VLQAHTSLLAVAPGTQARIPLTVILRHAYEALPLEWAIHQSGKTASLHGIAPFYLQRDIALLLGLLYAHGLQAPDWKSSPCILSPAILAAFIDGALYFGKGQIHSTQDATDLPTLAAQMHQHPQGIWRFLIGNQHLQGGQRNLAAFGQFLELPLRLQADAHALLTQADIAGLFTSTPLPSDDQAQLGARVQAFIRTTQGLSVREVLQRVADIALRHDKVLRNGQNFDFQLISIEHAKGLEFEYVALPFLEPGRFPAPAPHATAFLERNRLYVAMTRAKQKLWLLEHAQRPVPGFAS
jgi:DNA helicase-2/ATP-dependent DNA helicase PcrA